jgi:hypothetical protein
MSLNFRQVEISEVLSLLKKWLDIEGVDSLFSLVPDISQISPYFLEKLLETQGQLVDWEKYRYYEIIAYGDGMSEEEEKAVVLDLTKGVDLAMTEVILIADNMNNEIIRLDGKDLSNFMIYEFDELYGIGIFGPSDIVVVFVDLKQILVYRRDGRVTLLNLAPLREI